MNRIIVGYHLDVEGHWVAELDCGHPQHVRHDPPLVNREWVLSEQGRESHLGSILECVRCDEFELPTDLMHIRRTEEFTVRTTPQAIMTRHRTKGGVWGRITVTSGEIEYEVFDPLPGTYRVIAGNTAIIVPDVEHRVLPNSDARFYLDLFKKRSKSEGEL